VAQVFSNEQDVLPVTQPTVPKHPRKLKALTPPVTWPRPFFSYHQTPEQRGFAPFIPALQRQYRVYIYIYFSYFDTFSKIFQNMILQSANVKQIDN